LGYLKPADSEELDGMFGAAMRALRGLMNSAPVTAP